MKDTVAKAIPAVLNKKLDNSRLQDQSSTKDKDEVSVLKTRRTGLIEDIGKDTKQMVDVNSQSQGYKFMARELYQQAQKMKNAEAEAKANPQDIKKSKKNEKLSVKLVEKYRFPQAEAESLAVAVGAVMSAGPEAMLMAAQVMKHEAEKKDIEAVSLSKDISTAKERVGKINDYLSAGKGREMRMDQVTKYLKSMDDSLVREMMVRHLDDVLHNSEKKKAEEGLT